MLKDQMFIGYVEKASNAHEALGKVKSLEDNTIPELLLDFIIVDINMPAIDGYQFSNIHDFYNSTDTRRG